jgi:hypothetical protein
MHIKGMCSTRANIRSSCKDTAAACGRNRAGAALLAALLLFWGCGAAGPQPLDLPPGARIGILDVLESQITHKDVGSLRIDSFEKRYDVSWDLPGFIDAHIERTLQDHGRYRVIRVPLDWPASQKRETADAITSAMNGWTPQALEDLIRRLAAEYRLDAVVTVSSFAAVSKDNGACFSIGKTAIPTQGYGLYTRSFLLSGISGALPFGQKEAYAYAHIALALFKPPGAKLSGSGRSPCMKSPLADFPWPAALTSLTPAEIDRLKPTIETLAAEAADEALRETVLMP